MLNWPRHKEEHVSSLTDLSTKVTSREQSKTEHLSLVMIMKRWSM